MELLCVGVSLAALFLLCAFLTLRCKLAAALAPLTALGALVLWLTLWGMAGHLLSGMWAALAGCAALGAAAFRPRPGLRAASRALCTPGAALFWGGTALFAVYFFVRQPLAIGFDELNLWATAVKVTVTDDALYSTASLGVPWPVTQNPGLPLLGYFFSFFGAYADWKIYLAYDALALAVFAAVLGELRWGQYRMWVPLAAALWCVPWFFTTYNRIIYLSTVYMSAYGDIPAGLAVGGAVAVWLALRRGGGPRWAVLLVLALAANLKANTFVLALVAAGLTALDGWLFPDGPFRKGLAKRTGFAALCMAAPLVLYYLWNIRYVGALVAQNSAAGGMGDTTPSLAQVVLNGVGLLLGRPATGFYAEREAQFRQAMADMSAQFWTDAGTVSMVGQGCRVVALILVVFAAAVLLAPGARARWRIVCMAAASTVCFGGYNLMLALSYGFIFKPFQAAVLTDYNRYIYSYYIAWFLIALACLAGALQAGAAQPARPGRMRRGAVLAGQAFVLLLAGGMLLRWHQLVLPQLSVLGFSDAEFIDRRTDRAEAERVSQNLTGADRIFFVSQGDTGLKWFAAVFDFYPLQVDYSGTLEPGPDYGGGGGGTFGLPELRDGAAGTKQAYYHAYTAPQFDAIVRQSGCTVLYLQNVDEFFLQSYASLFTDGLAAAQNGVTPLYRVTEDGFSPELLQAPLPAGTTAVRATKEVAAP